MHDASLLNWGCETSSKAQAGKVWTGHAVRRAEMAAWLLETHQAEYGNILGLFEAILTLQANSADAEKGFSQLKLTKGSIQPVLKADQLTDLLTSLRLSQRRPSSREVLVEHEG